MNEKHNAVIRFLYGKITPSNKLPAFVAWLLRKKIARTERQAIMILILISLVSFSLAAYFLGAFVFVNKLGLLYYVPLNLKP